MIKGLYTNAAAMVSLQLKQEITANNLANVNTTGFKKDGVFRKYLVDYATILKQNATDFKNIEDVDAVVTDFSQGDLIPTSNPLDTAIKGSGFFVVETPDGIRYTRGGNFTLDQDGFITTQEGYRVMGNNGPVQIAGNELFLGDDGTVTVDKNFIDVLRIVDFPQPYNLNKLGEGLYEAEPGTEFDQTVDNFKIRQGFVEMANVETVEEMVKIIQTFRDFEANQKSIQMQDTTLDRAVNDVGRLNR
ncbi:MAG: flagellar basal-body rod protein FlgF [bacterium]|nr:flagellar basal-body rod protein FlgF [bacterium]